MALFSRYNSISASERFLGRCNDGSTVTIQAGERFKLRDVQESESGQIVRFDTPTAGSVIAISASPEGARPWRLSRV